MNISSYLTLDTALSGVEAAQEQLDTTGENITNSSTAGYEDQTVNLEEAQPLTVAGGGDGSVQLGAGVNAASVTNVGDAYLDSAWRAQNANNTGASTTQTYMQQVDTALDEPSSTGISSQLSQFWSDWNNVADNPTAASAKQAVVDDAQSLSTSFNSLSSELNGIDPSNPSDPANSSSILGQITDQYNNLTQAGDGTAADGGDIYNDAYNIASLNKAIVQAQGAGANANTLIDQRNQSIDSLSSLGNVLVQNNDDGSVNVYFGGVGDPSSGTGALVSDPTSAGAVAMQTSDPGNNFSGWSTALASQYSTAAGAGTSASSLGSSFGGTVGALIALGGYSASGFGAAGVSGAQQGTIGQISASLDSVASTLATEVNSVSVVNGAGASVTTTTPLFVASSGTSITASTLAVNATLAATPSTLQVASTGQTYSTDNDVALDEANNAGGDADTAYQGFVEKVGDLASAANDAQTTQAALQTQITNQRSSVEGVDLSTEMANLISEQQAYEACAKVMNSFSTVMDSLMSTVGQ